MFLSIPEEFFVPVLFSSKFELNVENNNMEYDTSEKNGVNVGNRGIKKEEIKEITEESEEKEKVEKLIKLDNENEQVILSEADEEYIHSQTVGR